jgi:hypothetical protein
MTENTKVINAWYYLYKEWKSNYWAVFRKQVQCKEARGPESARLLALNDATS